MSKFRKNKTTPKIEVCGKTPVSPVFAGFKDVMENLTYGIRNNSAILDSELRVLIENYEKFRYLNSGEAFFSVTKEHEPKSNFVEQPHKSGLIVSVGMLRLLITTILPVMLKDRYTHTHRGDKRKKETKSMDWVKPDFKSMKHWFKLLDTIWFVKESPCDIIEATGRIKVFNQCNTKTRYGYRMSGMPSPLTNIFMSKRYEPTSWYNTCRKCYYNDHADHVWRANYKNDYAPLRDYGMSYDTILSETAMSL